MFEVRVFGLHLGRHLAVVEVADLVGNEISPGAGMAEEVADLVVPMGPQRHHRDDADLLQRKEGEDEFGNVGKLHDDTVEGLKPKLGEVVGQMIGGLLHLGKSVAPLAIG